MLVSVHLTTFCQAESGWLERAIESILSQSYKRFELICYDDASYDGTSAILGEFSKRDERVRVITGSENVNSVSKSLGYCFLARNPKADAITWMFDDNVLEPGALECLVREMQVSGADVVYGQTRILMGGGGSWLIGHRSPDAIARSFSETSADVPNAGILIREGVFERSGWYDPNIIVRRSCDWDLFRRVWSSSTLIKKIDHICATEYGELSSSSLRNTFDTSFELMKKYTKIRDEHGFRLDPIASAYGPPDVVPLGDWTDEELVFIFKNFVRYFVSVGNLTKAAEWSRALINVIKLEDDLLIRNLEYHFSDRPDVLNGVLSGMFAGRASGPVAGSSLPVIANAVSIGSPAPFGLANRVSNFLRARIRVSDTAVEKAIWRNAFRVAQFLWRRRPGRVT